MQKYLTVSILYYFPSSQLFFLTNFHLFFFIYVSHNFSPVSVFFSYRQFSLLPPINTVTKQNQLLRNSSKSLTPTRTFSNFQTIQHFHGPISVQSHQCMSPVSSPFVSSASSSSPSASPNNLHPLPFPSHPQTFSFLTFPSHSHLPPPSPSIPIQ